MKYLKYFLHISLAAEGDVRRNISITQPVFGNVIAGVILLSAIHLGAAPCAEAHDASHPTGRGYMSGLHTPCRELLDVAQLYRTQIILSNERRSTKSIDKKLSKFEIPFEMATAPDTGIVEYRIYSSMDLDGDHRPDTVKERCGGGYLPACTLTVTLTSGKSFSEQTVSLNMIDLRGQMFGIGVLVAKLAPVKASDFTEIYHISKSGINEICQSIHKE